MKKEYLLVPYRRTYNSISNQSDKTIDWLICLFTPQDSWNHMCLHDMWPFLNVQVQYKASHRRKNISYASNWKVKIVDNIILLGISLLTFSI